MLEFQCPSCQAKCSVEDTFRGRKLRCPKCGTRIRHHLDGTMELLSVGEAAPAPAPAAWQALSEPESAAAPPSPAPPAAEAAGVAAPSAPAPAAPAPATGLVTKLTRQSESRQNTIVLTAVGVALVAAVVLAGLLMKDLTLAVGALAAGFAAATAVLYVRTRRKAARSDRPRPPVRVKDDEPTQPLARV